MRILYVWDADYPWDVRTEKVCLALAQHGHQVHITARNLRGLSQIETRPEGVVARLPVIAPWARRMLSFPAFFNPLWYGHIRRLVRGQGIDLIIARDLPLAPTALAAARRRIPVILDMAENYPAMIADIWTDGRQGPFDALVRHPRAVSAVERYALRRVSHTLTVVQESSHRLIELGVPPDKLSVVSNTPSRDRVATPAVHRRPSDPLRLVYLGLMEHHRGIGDVLEAMRSLATASIPIQLDLIGDGRDLALFKSQAARLGLNEDRVIFHGRLSHHEAIALVGRAHIGLVPHHATEAWNTTIPNKLFDYMAAGLAVVSSDARPAARVVRETGAGLVHRSGDARHLAESVIGCLDLTAWDTFRRAGQAAIRERFNWENDTEVLLRVVSMVVASKSGSRGG